MDKPADQQIIMAGWTKKLKIDRRTDLDLFLLVFWTTSWESNTKNYSAIRFLALAAQETVDPNDSLRYLPEVSYSRPATFTSFFGWHGLMNSKSWFCNAVSYVLSAFEAAPHFPLSSGICYHFPVSFHQYSFTWLALFCILLCSFQLLFILHWFFLLLACVFIFHHFLAFPLHAHCKPPFMFQRSFEVAPGLPGHVIWPERLTISLGIPWETVATPFSDSFEF